MRVPPEQRRTALAEAALRVISRDGVAAASTRAIAAEAGMSLASVHYVFASRDELLREAIALVIEEERVAAGSPLDLPDDIDLVPLLSAGISAYLGLVQHDPRREQGMLELTHYALRRPEMADIAHDQYTQYYALAGDLLAHVAERAGIRWTVPVDVLARWIVSFTDGLTMQWLAAPDEAAAHAQIDLIAEAVARLSEPHHPTDARSVP